MGQCASISSCLKVGFAIGFIPGVQQWLGIYSPHRVTHSFDTIPPKTLSSSHENIRGYNLSPWLRVIMSISIRVRLSLIQLSWYSDLWCWHRWSEGYNCWGAAASESELLSWEGGARACHPGFLGGANSSGRSRLWPWYGLSRSKETTQAGGFWCNCCVWEYRNGCCKH